MEMIEVIRLKPKDRFMWDTGEVYTFVGTDIPGPEVDGRIAVTVEESEIPLGSSSTHVVVLVDRKQEDSNG